MIEKRRGTGIWSPGDKLRFPVFINCSKLAIDTHLLYKLRKDRGSEKESENSILVCTGRVILHEFPLYFSTKNDDENSPALEPLEQESTMPLFSRTLNVLRNKLLRLQISSGDLTFVIVWEMTQDDGSIYLLIHLSVVAIFIMTAVVNLVCNLHVVENLCSYRRSSVHIPLSIPY